MPRNFAAAAVLIYVYAMIPTFGTVSAVPIAALAAAGILFANGFIESLLAPSVGGRARLYLELLAALAVWMLFLAGVNIVLSIGTHTASGLLVDLTSMSMLASGYMLCRRPERADKAFASYMRLAVGVGLVAGVAALLLADFSGGRSGNVWLPQYVLWGFVFPWTWMIFRFLTVRRVTPRLAVVAGTLSVLYISLGLLFGKRVVLLEVGIISAIAVVLLLRFGRPVAVRLVVLAVGVVLGFSILSALVPSVNIGALLQYTTGRVADDSLSTFDRYQEFLDMLHEYSVTTPIIGAGTGSTQSGPGGINLHIGWLNFAFKGGLPFVAVEFWVLSVAVRVLIASKRRSTVWLAACVVSFYFGIVVSSAWVASPILVGHSVTVFLLLRRSDEELPSAGRVRSRRNTGRVIGYRGGEG